MELLCRGSGDDMANILLANDVDVVSIPPRKTGIHKPFFLNQFVKNPEIICVFRIWCYAIVMRRAV